MGRLTLRLPPELHERLQSVATERGRSLNSQIVSDLETARSMQSTVAVRPPAVPQAEKAPKPKPAFDENVYKLQQKKTHPSVEPPTKCKHLGYENRSFCYRCGQRIN